MREVKERLIEKLMELGLTQNEAKAYVTLVELGAAAPLDVAALSGVPVAKIYYVLSELERKGIVESQQGKPKLYRAVEPSRALEMLAERYMEAKREAMKLLKALASRGRKVDTRTIWIIRGKRNILNRIKTVIRNAETSLAVASTDEVLTILSRDLAHAVGRGVNLSMVVYKTKERSTKALVEKFKRDAMVRIRDVVAPSMFIADDEIGVAYITEALYRAPGKRVETALLIEDEDFLPIFGTYFRFFLWYPSRLVTSPEEFLSKPRTYCIYYRAVEDARYLLSKGRKLRAKVEGWYIADGKRERVTLEGEIVSTYESEDRTVYNMTMITDDGTKFLLGGKRCILEDIETERITLIPASED